MFQVKDGRTQLPKCPLEYQVPYIPSTHTAIVIDINTANIEGQERMLPWTLASLINNTDIVMKGVHLYVHCEEAVRKRIEDATSKIEIQNTGINAPDDKIIVKDNRTTPLITLGEYGFAYDSVCMYDINYWAFRGQDNAQKLPLGHVLRHNWGWGAADYSLHPENDITQKNAWVPIREPLHLTGPYSPEQRASLANHLMEAGRRARWLHEANTAVYGENYEKRNLNIAAYFFNENEPNWHLDASLLQYPSREASDPHFAEWADRWKHIGTEPLIALWLLKTGQHAYNLRDSIMIEFPHLVMESKPYPQLCNMQLATTETLQDAIKQLTTESGFRQ